jgi:tyrosinase
MSSHIRLRKNVNNLSINEKTKFVNAILALKQAPSKIYPSDASRNRYDDYVEIHHHSMMVMSETDPNTDPNWYPGWAHLGPAFFPWHRQYLLELECDLQRESGGDNSITIPYWDWADASSSPFTGDFLGSDGEQTNSEQPGKVMDGPFAFDGPNHWTITIKDDPTDPPYLQRGFGRMNNARNLPTLQEIQISMFIDTYDSAPWKFTSRGFRRVMEINFHNLVHRWVNGTMVSMASPNDPVFWLHHANIDRLWGVWQRFNPTVCWYLPGIGAPEGHNLFDRLIFNDMQHGVGFSSKYPAELISHVALGYAYDSDPQEFQSAEIITRKPRTREKLTKHFLPPFPLIDSIPAG